MNELRNLAAQLFSGFAGQGAVLIIPRPYLTLCDNDHRAALLLSQCVYWSDRTKDAEGWFAKSYVEWLDELGLSEYEVRRAAKALAGVGLETKLKKFNGAPTVHYRIDRGKFSESILKKLQKPILRNSGIDPVETAESLTEITTEITSNPKDFAPIGATPPSVSETDTSEQPVIVDSLDHLPIVYPCTSDDINALIGAWWEWVPKRPTQRGAIIAAKRHFANKTIREFAENLIRRGVMPADMARFLGEIRHDDRSRWAYLRDREMPFNYVAEILQSWVEADRAENWYTPDAPRITPRKPGVIIDQSLISASENPLEDFADHPDFYVDVPMPYLSPHEADALLDDDMASADLEQADDAMLPELEIPL